MSQLGEIFMKRKIEVTSVLVLFLFSTLAPIVVNADNESGNDNYDMVIIAPTSYSSSLEPLIQHKNDLNIITKFVSLDDIYSGTYFDVQGRDDQEKIKYFIKDALESWGIVYVLFVGSIDKVPVRYAYNNDNFSGAPEPKFISELYYADIYEENGNFSTWDSDGDELYGEWYDATAEDKPIDLTPDVCLGRLACADTGEVDIMVNKIINYEKVPAAASWFKKMVVVGGDTYDEYPGYEGETSNQLALDAMDGFTPVKIWASTGTLTEKPWSILKEINKGCGFLYLSGHGGRKLWATYTPDGTRVGNLRSSDMLFLFNRHKLPVCLVGGCHNSEFVAGSEPGEYPLGSQSCWSWQLTSASTGGSIATFGTTGLCWYGVEYGGGGTDWLHVQFFREYAKGTTILGQIWKNVTTEYIQNYPIDWEAPAGGDSSIDAKTVQQWTLLGDPSLMIGGYSSNSRNKQDKSHATSNLKEIISNLNIMRMIETYLDFVKKLLQI